MAVDAGVPVEPVFIERHIQGSCLLCRQHIETGMDGACLPIPFFGMDRRKKRDDSENAKQNDDQSFDCRFHDFILVPKGAAVLLFYNLRADYKGKKENSCVELFPCSVNIS
jgi:hypothetical protein